MVIIGHAAAAVFVCVLCAVRPASPYVCREAPNPPIESARGVDLRRSIRPCPCYRAQDRWATYHVIIAVVVVTCPLPNSIGRKKRFFGPGLMRFDAGGGADDEGRLRRARARGPPACGAVGRAQPVRYSARGVSSRLARRFAVSPPVKPSTFLLFVAMLCTSISISPFSSLSPVALSRRS